MITLYENAGQSMVRLVKYSWGEWR